MPLTQTEVSQLYTVVFNRASEQEGNEFWQNAGDSQAEVAAAMLETDAAQQFFGGAIDSDQDFIETIFENALGKTAQEDPEGVQFWVDELQSSSRGQVVADIVEAAQDPENASPAQDQFMNRVAVSNFAADTIETVAIGELSDLRFDQGLPVDDSQSSVSQAQQALQGLADGGNGGAEGLTRFLTENADNAEQGDAEATGTADNDTFDGRLTTLDFQSGNTLNSGDMLDGNGGIDTLEAELTGEVFASFFVGAVRPTTESVEEIEVTALAGRGNTANLGNVTLDAADMRDVDMIGSFRSNADLTVRDLTTLTSDGTARDTNEIRIRMDHTANVNTSDDPSDLTVYFDENYLLSGEGQDTQFLELRFVNNLPLSNEDNPLPARGIDSFNFKVDGQDVNVDLSSIGQSDTLTGRTAYVEIKKAIEDELAAKSIEGVTVTVQPPEESRFNIDIQGNLSGELAGEFNPIQLTSTGQALTPGTPAVTRDADETSFDGANTVLEDEEQGGDVPVSIPIELEKVGRGSEGGDLTVGGKSGSANSEGIPVFNVEVFGGNDLPNNLASMTSTNGDLRTVNIKSNGNGELTPQDDLDAGENAYANLTIGNSQTDRGQDPAGSPFGGGLDKVDANAFNGDLTLGTGNTPVSDLAELNAGGMGGDLTLFGQLNDGTGDYQGPSTFFEATGNGTFNIGGGDLGNGNVRADFITASSLESGNGDDLITVERALDTSVKTNGGDDTVALDDLTRSRDEEGNVIFDSSGFVSGDVESGNGDDAIFTNGHAILGLDTQTTFNLNTNAGDVRFFGAQVQVTLNGVESEWVDIESGDDFRTQSGEIQTAIADAVGTRTELASVLAVTGDTITVQADGDTYDLAVNTRGPVAQDLVAADGLSGLGNLSAADIDPDIGRISESDIENAWSTYFPGSEFVDDDGDFSDSDEGGFGTPQAFNDFLDAMQDKVLNVNVFKDGGTGNDSGTSVEIDAGSGDDVITLSEIAGDTIVLDGGFDRTTVLNAQNSAQSNRVDFTSYLDVEAAERGTSVNDDLEAGDSHNEGFVPFQFQGNDFTENGNLSGPNADEPAGGPAPAANPTVDQLLTANLEDANQVDAVHNNIEMLSFSSLFDNLEGNDDTADIVSFSDFGVSELSSIFEEVVGPVAAPDGPGDADDPTDNEFVMVAARDGEAQYEVDADGNIVLDGTTDNIEASEFKVFEGSLSGADEDDEFNIEVDNLAGTLDLTDLVGGPGTPTNQDPVATDDTAVTDQDTAVTVDVLSNDSDPDDALLFVSEPSNPANGSVTVNSDGTLSYTPDSGFSGTDSFDYTVSDANGASDTGSVTVNVTGGGVPLVPGQSDSASPVTGTAGVAESFTLDVETAAATDDNTQFEILDFEAGSDTLEFNFDDQFIPGGADTLDDLNGVTVDGDGNQATVQSNAISGTTVTLGPDANGDAISLQLPDVDDSTNVDILVA